MRHTRMAPVTRLIMMAFTILSLGSGAGVGLAQESKARDDQPTRARSDSPAAEHVGERKVTKDTASARLDSRVIKAQSKNASAPQPATSNTKRTSSPVTEVAKMTEAEKIAILQRLIQTNRKELEELRRKGDSHQEQLDAQKSFQALDDKLEAKRKALKEAEQQGSAEQVKSLKREIEDLQQPWQIAKDRFDLDLREQKVINERIAILEKTIKHDEERLRQRLGNVVEAKTRTKSTGRTGSFDANHTGSRKS